MDTTRLSIPLKTVVIGSGNVASVIVPALEKARAITVDTVYSPTLEHAAALAEKLEQARAVNKPAGVPVDAELYLVAVKDDAIARLACELKPSPHALWLHTSGGVEASVMSPLTPRYGVFYPLQTFSKGREVDVTEVPIFIEAASEADLATVRKLAESLSEKVYVANGPTRAKMHAAAVFACNFTNHLWAIADDILRRETGTDLTVLHPLLEETLRKAMSARPATVQTGPAARGDLGVIEKHAALLAEDEAELYKILSNHIINYKP
ncbi:MAG: DUF2520 domain-containing protein [Firmicutes bacterium]|nr:DUF2520 domain-containing protein [Bacillota bacterium]MCM1401371.1 DUF2520 domain-containing protein [Bacteroides sp.]MCM1477396.1 DUF2520 domain-containing protein [Bacteroides sp.]